MSLACVVKTKYHFMFSTLSKTNNIATMIIPVSKGFIHRMLGQVRAVKKKVLQLMTISSWFAALIRRMKKKWIAVTLVLRRACSFMKYETSVILSSH